MNNISKLITWRKGEHGWYFKVLQSAIILCEFIVDCTLDNGDIVIRLYPTGRAVEISRYSKSSLYKLNQIAVLREKLSDIRDGVDKAEALLKKRAPDILALPPAPHPQDVEGFYYYDGYPLSVSKEGYHD